MTNARTFLTQLIRQIDTLRNPDSSSISGSIVARILLLTNDSAGINPEQRQEITRILMNIPRDVDVMFVIAVATLINSFEPELAPL